MLDPIYPEEFGAKADAGGPDGGATDNGPPIAAALAKGLASGSPVVLGKSGPHYEVRTTVRWHGGVGQALLGPNLSRRGPVDVPRGAWLWWGGPAGGKMVELYGMNCVVRGLGFGAANGTSLAQVFDVDNPAPLSIPYITSTEHSFERCHFAGGYGDITDGVVVGASNCPNNEFHRFESCYFSRCLGSGIVCHAGNGQAKGWQVSDCSFNVSGRGFSAPYGSCSPAFRGCNFNGLGCGAFWGNGGFEPVVFDGCFSENCLQFCDAWGVNSVALRDCRLAPNAAPATRPPFRQEWIVGGNDLLIDRVQFDSPRPGFYVRATDDGAVTLLGQNFYSPYLPIAVDDPPRFSVASLNSSYWTGTRPLPNACWRQDNIPTPGSLPVSQLAPLTVPPPSP